MTPPKNRAGKTKPATRAHIVGPLVLLLILLPIASWIIASSRNEIPDRPSSVSYCKPGAWGNLEYVRIAIELPDHYIDVKNLDPNDWHFPGFSRQEVMEFLQHSGCAPEQLKDLETAHWEIVQEGSRVYPGDDFIWELPVETRSRIYSFLAQFPENVDQANAFAFRSDRLEERLAFSGLQESTIELFKSLLYPQESLLRFADADIVLRKISDAQERMRFVKTISRRSSLLVKLSVTPETNVDSLLDYWGSGGRAKDLRPLLESLARVPEGCKIDIAHLLPPFVRKRLYTYPQPDAMTQPQQDCHWTSINFWNDTPLPPFESPEAVSTVIESHYTYIGTDLREGRLGDILFLQNQDGVLVHSAVFIADDIVFTKNGGGVNQPWIYMKMEDMLPFYDTPGDSLQVVIYRHNEIE